ncbi:hypothetical protein [Parabacteroides sp. Marseille-P3160]|uniref:hypothetical protein n=1 Tax=Parabacteroides sp. Marseille-P3160 TaxID=1917887 RepID=UPI0009BB3514|nr:hypothetical protein [Parabacteroides sp. Marseille-P3160]
MVNPTGIRIYSFTFGGVSSLRRVGSKALLRLSLKKDNHCEAGASLLSPTEAGASAEHNKSLPW